MADYQPRQQQHRRTASSFSRTGRIYYFPGEESIEDRYNYHTAQPTRLPSSQFQRRQRRPNSIHVSRFPADFDQYVYEQPRLPLPPKKPSRFKDDFKKLASKDTAKRVLGSVFPSWSFTSSPANPPADPSTRSASPETVPARPYASVPRHTSSRTSTSPRRNVSERNRANRHSAHATMTRPPLTANNNLHPASASRTSLGDLPHSRPGSINGSINGSISGTNPGNVDRPICTGNGVSCHIIFAEPNLYLTGFDHDSRSTSTQTTPALLRGKLVLNVTKTVKIKTISMTFKGSGRTDWPEGIPPKKTELVNEVSIRTQEFPFFNASWEAQGPDGYGTLCNHVLRDRSATGSSTNLIVPGSSVERPASPTSNTNGGSTRSSRSSTVVSEKDRKRLSLQTIQSRSFQKGEAVFSGVGPAPKGYKSFHPGIYEYNFEIALENTCPETIDVPLGRVKYELDVLIERGSAFRSNMLGMKEVKLIRVPDQESLEQIEPIAISRNWEDQLHYDIVISGKSFPLGGTIPIAFKLTPLAKVQCHRIKVFITENIDYYTEDKKVTRKDAQKKILLFEKHAGKPLAKEFQDSDFKFLMGGEDVDIVSPGQERDPVALNLLGNLSKGEQHWGATEIEMNVRLPSCESMKKERHKTIHPDTTWKNIQVHHWIKIVMRLSKVDAEDPEGKKRRHFEISIDSPFHILSCLAASANTALPEYSGPAPGASIQPSTVCGCPGAALRSTSSSPHSSSEEVPQFESGFRDPFSGNVINANALPDLSAMNLARPPQAHLSTNAAAGVQRPIHMLRSPSFNPPAFDAELPPPPLATPPPDYERIVGTPSHDGLADYFARLADAYSDDDDHTDDEDVSRATSRGGRVNVANPRTPGGRIIRSMDVNRDFMFRPEGFERAAGRSPHALGANS